MDVISFCNSYCFVNCVYRFTWSILIMKKTNLWLSAVRPHGYYDIVLNMIAIFDITLIFILATATGVLTSRCEEMRFYLLSYGHLTNISSEVLFTGEDNSRGKAIIKCFNYCRGDQRCIGMEVCKITEDRHQRRACCAWMITNKEQFTPTEKLHLFTNGIIVFLMKNLRFFF